MKTHRLNVGAYISMIGIVMVVTCAIPTSASPVGLCWRLLTTETGINHGGLGLHEPVLSSKGPDEAWMSWQDDGPHIWRWTKDRWSELPTPERPGVEKMRYPVVGTASSTDSIVALSANNHDGSSALHIAHWSEGSWEWLGTPLISLQVPFTHANEPAIAFGNGGQPIIAWSEELHVKFAGIFVARWDGSNWQRLGAIKPQGDSYYVTPTIAVDANGRVWLAWIEGRQGIPRVLSTPK